MTATQPVTAGSEVVFTLTPRNLGPGAAVAGWTVTDLTPSGLTATSIAGPGYTCTLSTLTCTAAAGLGAGEFGPALTVKATVDVGATGTLRNLAYIGPGPGEVTETKPLVIPTPGTDTTTTSTNNDAHADVTIVAPTPTTTTPATTSTTPATSTPATSSNPPSPSSTGPGRPNPLPDIGSASSTVLWWGAAGVVVGLSLIALARLRRH